MALFYAAMRRDSISLFTPWELFSSVLVNCISLEFERQHSPQVSRTLLGILADLNNAVVWMISTRPPTPKSSSSFNNPLVIVPRPPITIGIIVTFMFLSFFRFLSKVEVLILLFTFLQFYSVVSRDCKVHNFLKFSFFVDYHKVWSSGRD